MTTKNRSNSVTGNIGESVLGIVARRLLGATNLLDVLPLNVTPVAKCPDFRVRITPAFPLIFQTATGLNPTGDVLLLARRIEGGRICRSGEGNSEQGTATTWDLLV